MNDVRIRRDPGVDERTSHDCGDAVDLRMLDAAVRDRNDAMRMRFEQANLRRAGPAAYGEPGAETESGRRTGDDARSRDAMPRGEIRESFARTSCDAGLTEPRTTWTRWTMRA